MKRKPLNFDMTLAQVCALAGEAFCAGTKLAVFDMAMEADDDGIKRKLVAHVSITVEEVENFDKMLPGGRKPT